MPKPSMRTRSKKRLQTKSPGGRAIIHYGTEKFNTPRCSNCGQALAGLPRSKPSKLSKLPANQRKVARIYGGNLCHDCLRDLLRESARNL